LETTLPNRSTDPVGGDRRAESREHPEVDGFIAANLELAIMAKTDPEAPSLDDLFAEAMDNVKTAQLVKESRTRRASGAPVRLSDEDARRVREWEAAHEWTPAANVAAFEVVRCETCDTSHTIFSALMERQSHRTDPHAKRWVKVPMVRDGLPNEVAHRWRDVPMCEDCAGTTYSWPMGEQPTEWR
jgi:hypothetical protein